MRHEHLPVCLARGNDWRNIAIALTIWVLSAMGFYEKVIKVKADVAAYLN
jgi:hypothetical protein